MGYNEDRELVPLKADFDGVWWGYRRSQVKFYVQQTEAELQLLAEDRDSALSQVADLSAQLDQARAEVEALKQQLDEQARTPIEESALSDRLRRMVRLAQDEASDVVAAAKSAAEHEWARSQQSAVELRTRYENLVAEADEWRQRTEEQRTEVLARTRDEVQQMAREAEEQRKRLDVVAEGRRTQIEQDFEISIAARREEALRVQAERERNSRAQAQRRLAEANAEAERRIRRADEYADTMLRMRRDLAERVRQAQQVLTAAEPFLAATESGQDDGASDEYVEAVVHGDEVPVDDVPVPRQRHEEPLPQDSGVAATTS
ncbi:cellulose-binding protein [Saccharopolyspora sp. CA-218241]|uniref:cellulose-binding protein n=1 Tax=Saccharopolyspora sp. CA-218241 TaxID=3240027 RepID=UPI003D9971D3